MLRNQEIAYFIVNKISDFYQNGDYCRVLLLKMASRLNYLLISFD